MILTNTTRSDVGRDHDGRLGSLELVEDPVTLVLLLVTVDGCENVSQGAEDEEKNGTTYTARAIRPGEGNG